MRPLLAAAAIVSPVSVVASDAVMRSAPDAGERIADVGNCERADKENLCTCR